MVESSKISNLPVAVSDRQRSSFAKAMSVKERASVTAHKQSPHERRAIQKLDDFLESKAPPRNDVPRGYYLDILI